VSGDRSLSVRYPEFLASPFDAIAAALDRAERATDVVKVLSRERDRES